MGLLRFIGIALLIVLGVRVLVRLLFPWLIKVFVRKTSDNLNEQMKRQTQGKKVYESGDIEIRKGASNKGDKPDDDSEYVDYEEVKD